MSIPLPPTNYQWIGNTLSYDLSNDVIGLSLKFKKDGQTEWLTVYESDFTSPTTCVLPSSLGPTGTILGRTMKTSSGGWGNPSEATITNQ